MDKLIKQVRVKFITLKMYKIISYLMKKIAKEPSVKYDLCNIQYICTWLLHRIILWVFSTTQFLTFPDCQTVIMPVVVMSIVYCTQPDTLTSQFRSNIIIWLHFKIIFYYKEICLSRHSTCCFSSSYHYRALTIPWLNHST